MTNFYSVIIPTKDRMDFVKAALKSISKQSIEPAEIIVVDQSAPQPPGSYIKELREIVGTKINLSYFHEPSIRGLTDAKNFGLKHIKTRWVLFHDDDIELSSDYVEILLSELLEFDAVGASGMPLDESRQQSLRKSRYTRIFRRGFLQEERRLPRDSIKHTAMVKVISSGWTLYNAEVAKKYKFDARFKGYCLSEDAEFSERVSKEHRLLLVPSAVASDLNPANENRQAPRIWESKVASVIYRYKKNYFPSAVQALSLIWFLVGMLGMCVISAYRSKAIEPIKFYFTGLYKSLNGFKDLECFK